MIWIKQLLFHKLTISHLTVLKMTPKIMEENHIISAQEKWIQLIKIYWLVSVLPLHFFSEIMLFILDFKYSHGDIFQRVVNQLFNQKTPTYTSYYQWHTTFTCYSMQIRRETSERFSRLIKKLSINCEMTFNLYFKPFEDLTNLVNLSSTTD